MNTQDYQLYFYKDAAFILKSATDPGGVPFHIAKKMVIEHMEKRIYKIKQCKTYKEYMEEII